MCMEAIFWSVDPVCEDGFFLSRNFAVDVGGRLRQEVSLQLVLQKHVILRREADARSEKDKEAVSRQFLPQILTLEFHTCTLAKVI